MRHRARRFPAGVDALRGPVHTLQHQSADRVLVGPRRRRVRPRASQGGPARAQTRDEDGEHEDEPSGRVTRTRRPGTHAIRRSRRGGRLGGGVVARRAPRLGAGRAQGRRHGVYRAEGRGERVVVRRVVRGVPVRASLPDIRDGRDDGSAELGRAPDDGDAASAGGVHVHGRTRGSPGGS